MRAKQKITNLLQLKNNLKLISVWQWSKSVRNGSYAGDDRQPLSGLLDILDQKKKTLKEQERNCTVSSAIKQSLPDFEGASGINFTKIDSNVLYYIAGHIVDSIIKNQATCARCIYYAGSKKPTKFYSAEFQRIKRISQKDCLFFVNLPTFNFFVTIEVIFRLYHKLLRVKKDVKIHEFLVAEFEKLACDLPKCNDLKTKIIRRFVHLGWELLKKKIVGSFFESK